MKKPLKKMPIFSIIVIMLFTFFLTGCEKTPKILDYNAKCLSNLVYATVDERVNDVVFGSFLKENITKDIRYYNVDYDYQRETNDKYFLAKTTESEKIIIVDNMEDYKKIVLYPQEIDFEKEMVIIYISTYYSKDLEEIKKLELKDGVLQIELCVSRKNAYSPPYPKLRCLIIKLNKLDASVIKFINV